MAGADVGAVHLLERLMQTKGQSECKYRRMPFHLSRLTNQYPQLSEREPQRSTILNNCRMDLMIMKTKTGREPTRKRYGYKS